MKFALLICTYNVEKRQQMYSDVIHWWMTNSSFDIFIVDSSNNKFSDDIESKCKVLHFDQSIHTKCTGSSTVLELLSLNQAFNTFQDDWKEYDYVIKLTGKYTLPKLQEVLKKSVVNQNNHLICQSKKSANMQHTELVIFHSLHFKSILERMGKLSGLMESIISKVSKQIPSTNLPRLDNTSKYKRGAGDIMRYL
jgi:hypothetical protein